MKKIAIVILVLGIALSYSCKKEEGKEVSTTISGQLRTNGTEDVIKMNTELTRPNIDIYRSYYNGGGVGSGSWFEKVGSTQVDENGNYTITINLIEGNEYFFGVSNLDQSIYQKEPSGQSYFGRFEDNHLNSIIPGSFNNIVIYVSANSWVKYRIVNNNQFGINDIFNIVEWGVVLRGEVDTLMPWVEDTWSGKQKTYTSHWSNAHVVQGKLTRNGITIDTMIYYNVPPFDTSIVEIRY